MKRLRGAVIGTGFFANIQMPAWLNIPEAEIVAVCDIDQAKARAFATTYNISNAYVDVDTLLASEALDFVDIVTRPDSHLMLVEKAVAKRLAILCQKPLAPNLEDARKMVELAKQANVPFMVNENWRWQAWYREMKNLVDVGTLGKLFHATVHMRTGDGRGSEPYSHQPYFKDYPKLLIFETGVHFIDTLRMFLGDVSEVYAVHRRINKLIAGEDFSVITLSFESGATAVIDANRYTEPKVKSEAFARFSLEGLKGEMMLSRKLGIYVQLNEGRSFQHSYEQLGGYKGGSCEATQRHFIHSLVNQAEFETNGDDYLKTLAVVEAVYASAETRHVVQPNYVEVKI